MKRNACPNCRQVILAVGEGNAAEELSALVGRVRAAESPDREDMTDEAGAEESRGSDGLAGDPSGSSANQNLVVFPPVHVDPPVLEGNKSPGAMSALAGADVHAEDVGARTDGGEAATLPLGAEGAGGFVMTFGTLYDPIRVNVEASPTRPRRSPASTSKSDKKGP